MKYFATKTGEGIEVCAAEASPAAESKEVLTPIFFVSKIGLAALAKGQCIVFVPEDQAYAALAALWQTRA